MLNPGAAWPPRYANGAVLFRDFQGSANWRPPHPGDHYTEELWFVKLTIRYMYITVCSPIKRAGLSSGPLKALGPVIGLTLARYMSMPPMPPMPPGDPWPCSASSFGASATVTSVG